MKTEHVHLPFDLYSIEMSTKTMCLMFYNCFTDFCKYLIILDLTPATNLKHTGLLKTGKNVKCNNNVAEHVEQRTTSFATIL